MTLMGLGHGIGGSHHGGPSSVGGHGHATLPGHGHLGATNHNANLHGHSQAAHNHGRIPNSSAERRFSSSLLMAISPLDVFSLSLGAGATGILLGTLVPARWLVWFAVAGAVLFDFGVVKPVIGLMARFVSRPSGGLEGEVAKTAEAVTAFDNNGKGLVKLCLDGQFVQLLAHLDPGEKDKGVLIAKGDTVLVIEVDPAHNSCRVSRELASSLADDEAYASSQARM